MSDHPTIIQFTNPPTLAKPPGFSHVVEVTRGRLIYIAGQVSVDRSFQIVGKGDFRAQAEQVFQNLKAALAAVGADFSSVVKLNYYVLDMTNRSTLLEVRDRYVNTHYPPASTLVEVSKLAMDGFLLEIEAEAAMPG